MNRTRHIVLLALFVTIASILHVVESYLPVPLPVPGVKLGLANVVSLVVIVVYSWREALYVSILRVVLGSLMGGTFLGFTFMMSMGGALVSTMAMFFARRFFLPPFSLVGVSVLGAVVHNITQLLIAAIAINSWNLLWYLPYMLLFAIPTGIITGFVARYFLLKMSKVMYGFTEVY
jgi:heptaprenyl diphosphate synthase